MGIFLGALGDALQTGGDILDSRMKEDAQIRKEEATASAQEARDIRRDELAEKRAIATAQLKEEFARNSEQAKYTRLNNESDAIEAHVWQKKSGLINSIRDSVPNEGDFSGKKIEESDLDTIRKNMTPEDAEKYYGVKPETALSKVDDQIAAARAVGAYESRPALIEQRKTLFETDKQDRLERAKDAETKRKSDEDKEQAKAKVRELDLKERQVADQEKKTTGLLTKIARSVSSGGSEGKKTDFDKKVILLKEAGATNEEIANFITEKKQPSLQDLARSFMDSGIRSGMPISAEDAIGKANELRRLTQDSTSSPKAAASTPTIAKPTTKAAFDALPSGATYVNPADGKTYKKK